MLAVLRRCFGCCSYFLLIVSGVVCHLILSGIAISVDSGRLATSNEEERVSFFYHCLLLSLLFIMVSGSSSSGYLGWRALFYCGTP